MRYLMVCEVYSCNLEEYRFSGWTLLAQPSEQISVVGWPKNKGPVLLPPCHAQSPNPFWNMKK